MGSSSGKQKLFGKETHMKSRSALFLALAAFLAFGDSRAADHFVSPAGRPDAKGTRAAPWDVVSVLAGEKSVKPGDTVYLMAGRYDGKMDGIQRLPFEVMLSGTKEKPVKVMPVPGEAAHLNGAVTLKSSYAHLIGLEIGDLDWDPWMKKHKVPTALNAVGGQGAKIINCNIFGGRMGTGCWSSAKELEIYGCVIHDFGYLEQAGRGHGHAFYAQNEVGTKVFMHNIVYRGCGWNVHVYTQQGEIKGFDIIENICFIAGAYKPKQTMDNFLIAGRKPAERIRLIGNIGYQPSSVQQWRPNARLSNYRDILNIKGECRDNTLMGAFFGLSLGPWKNMRVSGNTIWSTGVLVEISSGPTGCAVRGKAKPDLGGYDVDSNTYIANGRPKPFRYALQEKVDEKDLLTFEQWQALGLDRHAKMLPGRNGKPTGTKVFVFPNKFVKGRANVGIFNWDRLEKCQVDLSAALKKGQAYRIYNCLDIRQTVSMAEPVLKGTYSGGDLTFPLRRADISPDFNAFLVEGNRANAK
jgi:hypothetical protein